MDSWIIDDENKKWSYYGNLGPDQWQYSWGWRYNDKKHRWPMARTMKKKQNLRSLHFLKMDLFQKTRHMIFPNGSLTSWSIKILYMHLLTAAHPCPIKSLIFIIHVTKNDHGRIWLELVYCSYQCKSSNGLLPTSPNGGGHHHTALAHLNSSTV